MTHDPISAAVLLVHGLGGTPHELGALPAQLKQAGFEAYVLVLPGHCSQAEDLGCVVMENWLDAVCEKYLELQRHHSTVHLMGMCMGSLLVCEIAKSDVAMRDGKMVMLAPTLFLDGWSVPWYQALRYTHYILPWLRRAYRIKETEPYGIKNQRLRAIVKKRFDRGDSFHYAWVPLQSIWQLDRLRKRVLVDLPSIRSDVLIIHAREDEFSTLRSAYALQAGIGAKAQILILENSYHMVCIDNDKNRVVAAILSFLQQE